ncbi:unnamed protein product, partial [Pylaiella littoralis]
LSVNTQPSHLRTAEVRACGHSRAHVREEKRKSVSGARAIEIGVCLVGFCWRGSVCLVEVLCTEGCIVAQSKVIFVACSETGPVCLHSMKRYRGTPRGENQRRRYRSFGVGVL